MLEQHNLKQYLPMGKRADSESLLTSPNLKEMQGRRVLIIRGNGGRALLSDTLTKRGAIVDYAEVYQRRCPNVDGTSLLEIWLQEVDVVIVTSNAIIDNLLHLCQNDPSVLQTPLVVISNRMKKHAKKCGYKNIHLSRGLATEDIIYTLGRLAAGDVNNISIQ
jgi:uroporphyrinogen-III synthase